MVACECRFFFIITEKIVVVLIIQFIPNYSPPELQDITSFSHITYIFFSYK
jgi:hypothetical protein